MIRPGDGLIQSAGLGLCIEYIYGASNDDSAGDRHLSKVQGLVCVSNTLLA